jgi:hypothetical protein
VAAMIFNLVSYGIKFLPEPPPEAPKQESESEPLKIKNKIKKKIKILKKEEELEKEPFFSFDFGELMQGVLKLSRGRTFDKVETLTSSQKRIIIKLDPIIILVHIEKYE